MMPVKQGTIERTDAGFQVVWTNKKGKRCTQLLDRQGSEPFVKNGAEVDILFDENGRFLRVARRGTAGGAKEEVPAVSAGTDHAQPAAAQDGAEWNGNGDGSFYNPYYFIPMPPRKTDDPDFGDCAPPDHGVFLPCRWHGCIKVKLTTATPLLIPDAQRAETNNDTRHKTFPIRMVNGKPYLSPTSVKGMLRSAYEAITNSRMGVFNEYRDRPGFRTPPREGLKLVPARIEEHNGTLKVRLLPGTSTITPNGPDGNPPLMYAAFYNAYPRNTKAVLNHPLPNHGDRVWFRKKTKPVNHGRYAYWRVTALNRKPQSGADWTQGYFFSSGPNADNKHWERIFFDEGNTPHVCDLTDEVKAQWEALIKDYQEIHREEITDRTARPPALTNQNCRWSRHIATNTHINERERELRDGTLCYAEVKSNSTGGWDVTALYPVQISRHLAPNSPYDVIKTSGQKHHLPATEYEKLSPADRVFGWVSQEGAGRKLSAYKGNVRIGHVECATQDAVQEFDRPGVPLAILGAPKHAQARFYLGDRNGGPQQNGISRIDAAYKVGKMLRGRKVYPHQNHDPNYWTWNPNGDRDACFYAQPPGEDERTNQNRSILGWVKPGTEFGFYIHFSNLADVELGALLWLLDLPEGHFLRLGGGKPLGFGSVRLTIDYDDGANWLLRGSALSGYYGSLSAALPTEDIKKGVGERKRAFEEAVRKVYGQGGRDPDFIQAFLKAANGFDGRRTHYPRKGRRASEHIYEWFTRNEKVGGQHPGRKLSLPSLLSDDPSLPYDPTAQHGGRP